MASGSGTSGTSSRSGNNSSNNNPGWIKRFCSLDGNEFLCEVDRDWIMDKFNLTGLEDLVSTFYKEALEIILDIIDEETLVSLLNDNDSDIDDDDVDDCSNDNDEGGEEKNLNNNNNSRSRNKQRSSSQYEYNYKIVGLLLLFSLFNFLFISSSNFLPLLNYYMA